MFNEVPRFPDVNLSPVGGETDQENLKRKRELYRWSTIGGYPPYLLCIPKDDEKHAFEIFDQHRFDAVQEQGIRTEAAQFLSGFSGLKPTLASIEQRYKDLHLAAKEADKADVYKEKNVGLRSDWYTDAVFAQQHFTGVNPTALKRASDDWVKAFAQVASDQRNSEAFQLISTYPSSLYVVDNSDYRYMLGLKPDALISAPGQQIPTANGPVYGQPGYGCAAVTLFSLSDSGKLHPLAICLDYKGSMKKSVTIINKRLTAFASSDSEAEDWPWRFAKMCSMTSDWTRHELAVHLTETHLVEEAIIIAAQRNLPDSHIVYQLLKEHWYKTLSLNYLARATLVPKFIEAVAPLEVCNVQL